MNGKRLADLDLELVDPERNARRRWTIRVERSLYERAIVVWFGRIGARGRTYRETFASDYALARRYDELVATRRRHGYVARAPEPAKVGRKVSAAHVRCACGGRARLELRSQGEAPRPACDACATSAPFTTVVRPLLSGSK